ncbi:helix-turn-helix domain-containing protein [Paenibacillus aurantiacus]|uniref:Helix-turn-helix domain-containing protein n=1 Tax=Paenibacillus aurantiacus TaxID=1936118 RepID=A0ABV5L037_9BACL
MAEEANKKNSLDDYPEVLEVHHIKEYMGIGKDQAYELVRSGQFHVVKAGRSYRVAREVFRRWFLGV